MLNYINADAKLIILALTFLYIYFSFNLGSKFIALISVSIIFLSFPLTSVLVTWILRVPYFGLLNVISIFLVIGIAADDIFVFMDAWK